MRSSHAIAFRRSLAIMVAFEVLNESLSIRQKNVEFRDGMGLRLGNGISHCFFALLMGGA